MNTNPNQASPAPLTDQQIGDCVTTIKPYPLDLVGVPAEQLIAFARNVEAAALASPQVAPAPADAVATLQGMWDEIDAFRIGRGAVPTDRQMRKWSDALSEIERFAAPAPVAPTPARDIVNLEGLADRLLAPREIVRDEEGYLIHPEVPACDESVRADLFLAVFGLEAAFVGMDGDCEDEDLVESVIVDGGTCIAWTPTPPEGDGWALLEIYPTEDGPYAMFAREAKTQSNAARHVAKVAPTPAQPSEDARDMGFNAGTVAALAVVRAFDQETVWQEILNAAGRDKLIQYAAHVEREDWQWAGFDRYVGKRPKKSANLPSEPEGESAAPALKEQQS